LSCFWVFRSMGIYLNKTPKMALRHKRNARHFTWYPKANGERACCGSASNDIAEASPFYDQVGAAPSALPDRPLANGVARSAARRKTGALQWRGFLWAFGARNGRKIMGAWPP
jgi:hypothetical protein